MPVKILNITVLDRQLDNNLGTWIKICIHYSPFSSDWGNFTKNNHPPSLQATPNDGFTSIAYFYTFLENDGIVTIPQNAAFLHGAALSDSLNEEPKVPNFILAPSSIDYQLKTTSNFNIVQFLNFARDENSQNSDAKFN